MTTIYHYSPSTGELVGQSLADENPLDPENPLIPAHATEIAPPADKKGSVAVFDGSAWTMVVDQRNKTIYNKSEYTQSKIVEDLGPIPTGWTLKKPTEYSVWSTTQNAWVVDTDAQTTALENKVRSKRDTLLTECDWRVVRAQELGTTLSDEWKNYRELLRNVPEQSGFPTDISWPEQPSQ